MEMKTSFYFFSFPCTLYVGCKFSTNIKWTTTTPLSRNLYKYVRIFSYSIVALHFLCIYSIRLLVVNALEDGRTQQLCELGFESFLCTSSTLMGLAQFKMGSFILVFSSFDEFVLSFLYKLE